MSWSTESLAAEANYHAGYDDALFSIKTRIHEIIAQDNGTIDSIEKILDEIKVVVEYPEP